MVVLTSMGLVTGVGFNGFGAEPLVVGCEEVEGIEGKIEG